MARPVRLRPAGPPTSAVSRAMMVMEHLAGLSRGATVSELSQSLEIEISVVSRLLSTLEADGYVQRSPVSPDRYGLGWRLAALTYRFVDAVQLPGAVLPVLRTLSAEVNEMAQLAVVDGSRLRFVAKADPPDQRVMLRGLAGRTANPDTTATGKAWLAFLNDEERRDVLANTVGDVPAQPRPPLDELLADLAKTKERGYALETRSNIEEVVAIAMPVWAGNPKRVVGVVTISGLAHRLDIDRLSGMAPALRRAATALESIWPAILLKEHVSGSPPGEAMKP